MRLTQPSHIMPSTLISSSMMSRSTAEPRLGGRQERELHSLECLELGGQAPVSSKASKPSPVLTPGHGLMDHNQLLTIEL